MIQETSSRRESFQLEGVVQERATEAHRRSHPELSGRCQLMTCALAMGILASLFIPDCHVAVLPMTIVGETFARSQSLIFNLFPQISVALNPGWAMHKNFSRKGRPEFLPHQDDYQLPISHLDPSVLICTKLSKRCYSFLLMMLKTPNTRRPKFVDDGLVTTVHTVSGR